MKYKVRGDLADKIGSIEQANSKIESAYEILLDVKNMIDNGEWTGRSQEMSKALCEICSTYHKKIVDNTSNELNVLKKLYDSADGYMSGGKIPNEWR